MHKIFETNPDLKKAYITSDGTPFYQETDAKNHAKTLKDKSVEPVFNEKELQVVDEEELTDADREMAEFEAAEKEKEAKAELAKSLAEFDPAVTKYPEAVKLFKALGLEAENEKKDTIFPLLVAAKASAQEGTNTQE
jgi:hydroxylamine reductase (hybrid-cluster protein)